MNTCARYLSTACTGRTCAAILWTLCALAAAVALIPGCIGRVPSNPAATQPVTAVDPATTQPSYWLGQPAVAQVQSSDFDTAWEQCKSLARDYLFELDRLDPRGGVITTAPMISKQFFEVWRHDAGTSSATTENTFATVRRTLRFEFTRNADGAYTITPKVLVERQAIVERRITSAVQYRSAFAGPATEARYAVQTDPDTANLPVKYWYAVGRDASMESQVAGRLKTQIARARPSAKPQQETAQTAPPAAPAPRPAAMQSDGEIVSVGETGTIYINRGAIDKIVPGMTFEVYDNRATIPPLEHYQRDNPGSKGWIEVVNVANSSSTCRVVQSAGSRRPDKGDLLFNFVYDQGRQNHFAIAGDLATSHETITGMIWRWNGVVDDILSQRTNYLIVGQAPREELAREAYKAAIDKAQQMKTPVLDEEKFNLLIRHYDPSKR